MSFVEDFIVVRLFRVSQSFWPLLSLVVFAKLDTLFFEVWVLWWSQSYFVQMTFTTCCTDVLPLAALSSLDVCFRFFWFVCGFCLSRCFLLDCERNPGWGDYGCFYPALVTTDGFFARSG